MPEKPVVVTSVGLSDHLNNNYLYNSYLSPASYYLYFPEGAGQGYGYYTKDHKYNFCTLALDIS